jgi:hypothetical protein
MADNCDFSTTSGGSIASCPGAYPQVQIMVMELFANATETMAGGLGPMLEKGADFVRNEVPDRIDQGLGGMVAVIWILVIISVIAVFTKCKADDCILLFFGTAVLILVLVAICIEITVANVVSGVCYEGPDTAVPRLLNEYADLSKTGLQQIEYIISCQGNSTLEPVFINVWETVMVFDWATQTADYDANNDNDADAYLRSHGDAVQLHGCAQDIVDEINGETTEVAESMYKMWENFSCPKANDAWVTLMYDVVCTNLLDGMFEIAVVQFASWLMIMLVFFMMPCANDAAHGKVADDDSDDGHHDMEDD